MTRVISTLLGVFILAGCASEGKLIANNIPNSCGNKGHTFVFVKYGDSHIGAKAVIKVKAGRELQYRLMPDRGHASVYEDSLVTITSKSPPNPVDGVWVQAVGTFNSSGGVLKVCVPASPTVLSYYYEIDVANVGTLDPRADVEL